MFVGHFCEDFVGCLEFSLTLVYLYFQYLRRMKYIDDDLQPRRFHYKGIKLDFNAKTKNSNLPTTPFTLEELQSINLGNHLSKSSNKKEFSSFYFQSQVCLFFLLILRLKL